MCQHVKEAVQFGDELQTDVLWNWLVNLISSKFVTAEIFQLHTCKCNKSDIGMFLHHITFF